MEHTYLRFEEKSICYIGLSILIDDKSFYYAESTEYTLISRSLIWTHEEKMLKSKHIIQFIYKRYPR